MRFLTVKMRRYQPYLLLTYTPSIPQLGGPLVTNAISYIQVILLNPSVGLGDNDGMAKMPENQDNINLSGRIALLIIC